MAVTLRVVNRTGDQTQVLEVDEAKREVEEAARNGYIPTYQGRRIVPGEVVDGMEVLLTPTGMGG